MRTSQSFAFYPSDFIMGTLLLTAEEVGAYIRLLCWQWEQGSVPADPVKISRIAGLPYKRMGAVLEKFDEDSSGDLKNFRLEEVRKDRENYLQGQREKGLKGGRPKGQRPKPGVVLDKPAGFIRVPETESRSKAEKSLPLPLPLPLPNTPLPPEGDVDGDRVLDDQEKCIALPNQPTSEAGKRIQLLFHRRPSTPWSDREVRALRKLEPIDPDDLDLVEDYYLNSGSDFLRRDVLTFLNNFQGEVDRVRKVKGQTKEGNQCSLNPMRGRC